MAEYERILATLGAVPLGARPKTILAGDENQESGYYQTDPLSNLVRTLKKRKLDIEDKLKKEQEAAQKKIDMYKTLRESGYDPKSAYDAVKKNQFPELPGTDEVGKKTSRERILGKIAKGEALTTGEQQVYDDTIKHKETDENLLDETIADKTTETETATQKKMREQILDKIARGTPLTPGEQKIYDEVIKKSQPKPQEDLSTVIKDQEEMIAVIAPDGSKGSVPKSKLARALAAGYKKR